jgi:hypothetical protein
LREQFWYYRAKIKKLVKEAYRIYVEGVERQMKAEPKKFWEYINTKRNDCCNPTILRNADQYYADLKSRWPQPSRHISHQFSVTGK